MCVQDLRSNYRHSREEFTRAIEKLKTEHAKSLITINYLAYITTQMDDPATDDDHDLYTQCPQDPEEIDDSELACILMSLLDELWQVLSNSAFMHSI